MSVARQHAVRDQHTGELKVDYEAAEDPRRQGQGRFKAPLTEPDLRRLRDLIWLKLHHEGKTLAEITAICALINRSPAQICRRINGLTVATE